MARITSMQNEIAQLQQCLRERNETIARQNRDISEAKAKHAADAETISKLREELEAATA